MDTSALTVTGIIATVNNPKNIGTKACVLLDTGADINVMGFAFAKKRGWENLIMKYDKEEGPTIRLGGTTTVTKPIGYLNMNIILHSDKTEIDLADRSLVARLEILLTKREVILGVNALLRCVPRFMIGLMTSIAKQLEEGKELTAIDSYMDKIVQDNNPRNYDTYMNPVEGQLMYPWKQEVGLPIEEQLVTIEDIPGFLGIDDIADEYKTRLKIFKAAVPETLTDVIKNDHEEYEQWIHMIEQEFVKVFVYKTWTGIKIDPIEIETLMSMPAKHNIPSRHINREIREKVQAMIMLYLAMTFYFKESSPTVSGVVVVIKPDGSPRICCDFRWINEHLKGYNSFMPDVKDSLDEMEGCIYFCDLDWLKAYHQFPLGKATSRLLAMITPWGVMQPNFLPEGVAPASAIMQEHVQQIFQGCTHTLCIADNILVGAKTIPQLRKNVRAVLEIAQAYNIILSIKKCTFGAESIKFFGYKVSAGMYTIDNDKREAVANIQHPRSAKAMKSFIGLAGFFSPFIYNYADKAAWLHEGTKKAYDWKDNNLWSKMDKTVDEMKTAMYEATEIFYPNKNYQWILRCDASQLGVGGVLLQAVPRDVAAAKGIIPKPGHDYVYQPLWMGSEKLSIPAQNWAAIESETYAIVFCLKKLDKLLALRPFVLETDHANILYLEKSEVKKLVRWRLYIQEFAFILRHIPGVLNIVADYYSRHNMTDSTDEINEEGDGECIDVANLNIFYDTPIIEEKVKSFQNIMEVHDIHNDTDSAEEEEGLPAELEGQHNSDIDSDNAEEIQPHRNAIQQDNQEIEQLTQTQMFQRVHNARRRHKGAWRTYLDIKARYPEANFSAAQVQDLVEECHWCQKHRLAARGKLQAVRKHLHIGHMRSTIAMDTLTLVTDENGYKYLMVFINTATKRVHLHPSKDRDAPFVRDAILEFIRVNGLYDTFWSDPGSEFDNDLVKELISAIGMDMGFTLVNRPQANGVERTNGIILEFVRMLVQEEQLATKWSNPSVLTPLQLMLNENVNEETGYSPNELTFGLEKERYGALPKIPYQGNNKWVKQFSQDLERLRTKAAAVQNDKQLQRIGEYQDKGHRYQKDDFVFVRIDTPILANKFVARNSGPYRVVSHDNNSVELQHLVHHTIKIFHASKLFIFTGTEAEALELARGEAAEQQVDKILSHEGNVLVPSTTIYKVLWADQSTTMEGYADIKDTMALVEYGKTKAYLKILELGVSQYKQWQTAMNKIKVQDWDYTQYPYIPQEHQQVVILSMFYYCRTGKLQLQCISDFHDIDRAVQGIVVQRNPNSKSIDIHIPALDNTNGDRCIHQLSYSKAIQYLIQPGTRRSTDYEILQERDFKRTRWKDCGIWDLLYPNNNNEQ